ncbi:diaminopropionate ammonia-lyase [Colletotrichum kahawae]|uniref:Diaminopropionate ammonia-lyase n=1 Tax=Colletotrichum kahawae TaxID=34407 RepID=A0AAD9YEN0_COLKA|nr:diaminopropionate ammonia-lyase [Colletotrichum kahawae]
MTITHSHHLNNRRLIKSTASAAAVCVENLGWWKTAVNEIQSWPEYTCQPLRALPNAANSLGVGNIFVKDESKRFGDSLGSFKALGAPYAVFSILADEVFRQTGVRPSSTELRSGKHAAVTRNVTVCVATDGNQGRGLAYGAKIFGYRCVDYIHSHYEESVRRAREDAHMNGWHFVSSTSWSDFDESIPETVMNAYMVVVEETLQMLPCVGDITHVFVCGGVGSIAAAVFMGLYKHFQELQGLGYSVQIPRFVVIEPNQADCLLQSAKAGEIRQSYGSLRTLMAGLAGRGPSPAAWKVLEWLASDFISVSDSFAVDGMRFLAEGCEGDIPVVCGESSAASMGLLLNSSSNKALRKALGLDEHSHCLLFGLEGATDPQIYEELVGCTPETVFEVQKKFLATQIESLLIILTLVVIFLQQRIFPDYWSDNFISYQSICDPPLD